MCVLVYVCGVYSVLVHVCGVYSVLVYVSSFMLYGSWCGLAS